MKSGGDASSTLNTEALLQRDELAQELVGLGLEAYWL
jgi:hypothetical protein